MLGEFQMVCTVIYAGKIDSVNDFHLTMKAEASIHGSEMGVCDSNYLAGLCP